jgi:lipid A oxidase
MSVRCVAGFAAVLVAFPAMAGEIELSGGLGYNFSPHSIATLTNSDTLASQTDTLSWDGASFDPAPYYTVRLTYWSESLADWGFGVDYTHAKAVAKRAESNVDDTYSWLEFTDGLNLITANVFHKWDWDGARVYVGGGAGVAIPHVEIDTTAGSILGATSTREAQIAGPAIQLVAGASYELFPGIRAFGEYKVAYSVNDTVLAGGAGTFSTNLVNHQIVGGLSFAINDGSGL